MYEIRHRRFACRISIPRYLGYSIVVAMVCGYSSSPNTNLKPGIDMAKASTIFPSEDDPNAKAKEIRGWLASKGVRDFEPVPLHCDQLEKVHSQVT